MDKEYYTVAEASKELGWSKDKIYTALRLKHIKARPRLTLRGQWQITSTEIERFKKGQYTASAPKRDELVGRNGSKTEEIVYLEEKGHHDKEIFTKSDDILSELEFRPFLGNLKVTGLYKLSYYHRLSMFRNFFTYEQNKYLLPELKNLCSELCKRLVDLTEFLISDFDDVKQLRKPPRPRALKYLDALNALDFDGKDKTMLLHPELRDKDYRQRIHPRWRRKDDPVYLEYKRQLRELINRALEAYKSYRVAIRETLFL